MSRLRKLIRRARKWQEMASTGGKSTWIPRCDRAVKAKNRNTFTVAEKGHFVVYTTDKRRFAIPLTYLYTNVFQELFKMSEEEFGFSSEGPIVLPCDAVAMNYVIMLVERSEAKELERPLLSCIATSCCSRVASVCEEHASTQLLVCGY